MVEYDRNSQSNPTEALRICVAGIGGAGSNVLDRIAIDRTVEATLISFQTDVRVLNRSSAPHKIQMGTDLMRGIGSGGDPDLGREAAMFSRDEIRAAMEGHDMVFLSTGLGGGTGSGATPVIAEIAKSTGAVVVIFATVPFSFEGRRRQQQCNDALERLEKCADALILFDNSRMGELVLPKDGIQKAFAQGDQLIGQSVRAVTSMVSAPGLVKLGLDDLVAALRVSEGRCVFGFGEAKGQSRGTEALKRALKSPLINQGELLQNAKNLLVHIVGGESLTLAEVESVMKQLGRHVPDETQILFGIGIDPKLGDSMTISLISALSAQELATARKPVEEAAPAAPAPQAKSVRPVAAVAKAPAQAVPVAAPVSADVIPDLFGSNAPVVAKIAPPEAASPEVSPKVIAREPAPAPKPVAREPAPAPVARRPEPVAVPEPEPIVQVAESEPEPEPAVEMEIESEMVYTSVDDEPVDEILEDEAVVNDEAEDFAPPPAPEAPRTRLNSLISEDRTVPHPETAKVRLPPVDEVNLEPELEPSPPPILAPMPETARVPVSRPATSTSTTVVRPAASQQEAPVVARQPEPAALPMDLPSQPAPVAAVVKKPAAPAEQPSLRLGGEDRGRFKDTEPSFATQSNEDLDTPTWMRLRRKVSR